MTDQETLAPKPPEGTPPEQLHSQEQQRITEQTQGELEQLKGAEMESIIGKIASLINNEEFKNAIKEEKFGAALMLAIKTLFGEALDSSGKKQQEIEQTQLANLPEFENLLTKMKSEKKLPQNISISATDIGLLNGKGITSASDLSAQLEKFTEEDRSKLEKIPQFKNELEKGISIYRYLTLLERARLPVGKTRDQKPGEQNPQSPEQKPDAAQPEAALETSSAQSSGTNKPELETESGEEQKILLDAPKSAIDTEAGQCCSFEIKGHPPVTIKHDRIEIAGKAFHIEAKVKKFGFESFLRVGIKKITPNGDNFDIEMGAMGQSETKSLSPEQIKTLVSTFDQNKEKKQFDYKVQTGADEQHFKFLAA